MTLNVQDLEILCIYCVYFRLLKQTNKNSKIMSSDPIASRQIDGGGGKAEMVATFLLILIFDNFNRDISKIKSVKERNGQKTT